jgi:cytidylate kinase
VARAVARALGYQHVDTGAMYRAIAWKALSDGIDLGDEQAAAAVARRATLTVGDGKVAVDGRDVSAEIRTPEIDAAAAAVARQPRVREILITQQRQMGREGGIVMEGRDIGTVVFPQADVKLYLDASPEERARRRANDPAHAAGRCGAAVQDVATALEARDRSDRTRPTSPLTRAADAIEIDTTDVAIDEVIARVLRLVESAR